VLTCLRQIDPVGDGIAATVASSYAPGGDHDGWLCRHCGGGRRLGLAAECQTLIRHAAATGAIFAASIGMHPTPAIHAGLSVAAPHDLHGRIGISWDVWRRACPKFTGCGFARGFG
jgi:hypothetical protein